MEDRMAGQEILVMEGKIKVPYRWAAGETGTRYLQALRDEMKFLGTRCPRCSLVYHPPRRHCPDCGTECGWEELSGRGVLLTYTVVRRHHPRLAPLDLPFAYGIVKLRGADTGFVHLLHEFAEGELRAGLEVEAVFATEREGSILDVRYFRPVREVV
jgi:uncharacterized OB-fold protein